MAIQRRKIIARAATACAVATLQPWQAASAQPAENGMWGDLVQAKKISLD